MPSPTFYDNFTNTTGSDVLLTAHTPSSGSGSYSFGAGSFVITPSSFVRNSYNGQSYCNVPITPSSSGAVVSFDLQVINPLNDYFAVAVGGTSTASPYGGGVEIRYN